ncbi:voltage-dependent T-type calcium channel subunit alpha-1G isoform X9 [Balearica regulorum gibbericeps]|uniref:voltage-dependent T-type calcium channel subunit alpha-1G isoform X9 n=1 Tax=Balearica regulorum gibbericeps TaxID=100784 RepID=UPI003F5F8D91
MDEDGPRAAEEEPESGRAKTFIRLNDLSGAGGRPGPGDREAGSGDSEAEALPYPALAPVVFFYLSQESRPRSWCLRLVCNPWFERVSMLVILLNCVTLGMFHPCEDIACDSPRCRILQSFDDFIFAFFAVEMIVKMIALGIFGKKCYLGDTWNRLDFFIVIAGMLEYSLDLQNVSFSAVRTVRVLRPLRAINRVPSMRILVTLLLDTLPMLGNVLLLCFFVFFIFGIVGVQLWAGLLRNRCFLPENFSIPYMVDLERYYQTENEDENPFICSQPRENGMRYCRSIPTRREEGLECTLDYYSYNDTTNTSCVNWNQYYTNCSAGEHNPFKGAINFDNIGYAWIAIFQVITLEGWVDIMYFVMDAHSFYNFIYFILLIIVGSFFMINLCLVVIATQFSETKQRESQLMKEQRVRYLSNASTLASFSEPGSCYDELLKYLVYIARKGSKQLVEVYRVAGVRMGFLTSPTSKAGADRHAGKRRSRKRSSVHHLIHHHHHHHHHYHLGNGNLRAPRASPEISDVETSSLHNGTNRLMLPPSASNPHGAPSATPSNTESVHSIYHADCHFEPVRCRSSLPQPGLGLPSPEGIPKNIVGSKVYPTVHPSTSHEMLKEKNLGEAAVGAGSSTLTSLNIPPGPYSTMHKLLETQSTGFFSVHVTEKGDGFPGPCQSSCKISSPCTKLDGGSCNPESCPYCLKALASEAELSDNETADSDSEGVYEFTQDAHYSDQRDPQRGRARARRASRVLAFWHVVCETFRKIVDSKYFGRGIMVAILINTLSMGIEYHEQGDASKSDSEGDLFPRSLEEEGGLKKNLSNPALMALSDHPELKKSLTPPLIIHTAATPMPMPKSAMFGDAAQGYESRRASGVSVDPAAYELKSPPSTRSSPHSPWSAGSSWNSRRSSWNSIGRAPSLKRRGQSSERRSLLSGEGKESSEEGESSDEEHSSRAGSFNGSLPHRMESLETKGSFDLQDTLQVPSLYRTSSMHSSRSEHQDCNGKTSAGLLLHQLHLDDPRQDCDDCDDEGNMSKRDRLKAWVRARLPTCCKERDSWSIYIFAPHSRFRLMCNKIITHKMFDHIVLVIIFLNCITIAMERPKIEPHSAERIFLTLSNYIFTVIFLTEMTVKVVALGLCFGEKAYLKSSWNVLDGVLVLISVIDILVSMVSDSGTKILGMLRVLRLLRTLRPLRVISRAQGLKLVVETLMSSLKPIGNIVVICCAFFIIFGILGVQLFKGKFFVCQGEDTRNITNKSDCTEASYKWVRHKYNFDNLGQALMSLFVLASKDGWVDIMYDGLDAVGVDQQPVMNYNPWMLLYFISFLLIVAFFVLNMFVGVVVENFHKCRQHQEEEEAKRREEKRLRRLEKKRRNLMLDDVLMESSASAVQEAQCKPYYSDYSRFRLLIHQMCTSHYLDLFITGVIGLNVITMAMEHYQQPKVLDEALKICNYIFTVIFVLESVFKLIAFGFRRFFQDRWNQLDLAIVLLSIMGITLEEIEVNASLPINPTIIRIMRVLRIARVLKLLKMAVGMRALLDTVMQALPQVGNLGLLFMLLFFIFAALGVELFGDLECDDTHPCEGLGRHATFRNFGMAFLTLFRVSTGDNWNGIMKDTLRDCDQESTCYNTVISPIYFVSFVLTAQFVLVNVVIAVLMKHLEESNKEAKEEAELEAELEMEMKTITPGQHSPSDIFAWTGSVGGERPDSPRGCTNPMQIKVDSQLSLVYPTADLRSKDDTLTLSPSKDLLSVRKPSVGRTHSLPNDSYMFQPPYSGPCPASLGERNPAHHKSQSGSKASVQSQPADTSALLQIPKDHFHHIRARDHLVRESKSQVSQQVHSPSAERLLRRQMAIRNDSLDSKENLHTEVSELSDPNVPAVPKEESSMALTPSEVQELAAWSRASVHTQQHSHNQYNISKQAPASCACADSYQETPGDSMDQEVSEINSSSEPFTSETCTASSACSEVQPLSPKRNIGNTGNVTLKDLKKYHSVDTQGLLKKPPSWLDDQRRHSIEICSMENSPQHHSTSSSSGFISQVVSEMEGLQGTRQKKKLSPPCISIDPPDGQSLLPRGPHSISPASGDICLRRRAPSCESKDSMDIGDSLLPDSMSTSPTPKKDLLTLPSFSFDQTEMDP